MSPEEALHFHATDSPERIAIVSGGASYTYGQLYDMASRRAAILRREDVRISVFRQTQDVDFFVNYFGAHIAGAVAVPMERNCHITALESEKEKLKRRLLPNHIADILYTTGTTGEAKGVMISHKAITANAENLIEAQSYTPDLTFIIVGPLNHIGSLSKVWAVMLKGAKIWLLDGMKDLNMFFEVLDKIEGKVATFLVPANIRMLLLFGAERLSKYKDKIDFIETGAAPVTGADMQRLCTLLPESRLYNTYASTETGIISTHDFSSEGCMAGCVGKIMKHSSVEISTLGTIICKGATLMSGYVGDGSGINSESGCNAVHTKDLGFIDSKGLLHLRGRNDDIINVGGFKVAPTEVEEVAMQMDEIEDCLCVPVSHPVLGNTLRLLVVLKDGATLRGKDIATFMSSMLETYKLPLSYQFVEEIKHTFNGKPDRKAYNTPPSYSSTVS